MIRRCLRSNKPSNDGEEPTECMVNLSVQQFKPGDIVWSKTNGESWWPVQVIDEKCVAFKPKKRNKSQILVRLYGTFEHMYVEPLNCVSKIEKIVGQENSSNKEVFQKALEEDLAHMNSGGQYEKGVSESKENEKEKDENPGGKSPRKGKSKRTVIADNTTLVNSSENPKAAKQVKVVMGEGMHTVKGVGIIKRRTRSATFKARNEEKIVIDLSDETENVNSGASTISSSDKKDSRSSRYEDAVEKLTSITNSQIEFSDKDIKKLVAKIVKEVAAEKARNEGLKAKGMENTEYIENLSKESSVPSDVGKRIGADKKVINGGAFVKIPMGYSRRRRDFDTVNMEKTRDTVVEETQGINGVNLREMAAVKPSEAKVVVMNGGLRGKVVEEVVSREQTKSSGTTKCNTPEENGGLRPRCEKVMRSLGLIPPLGSPFRRDGLIKSP